MANKHLVYLDDVLVGIVLSTLQTLNKNAAKLGTVGKDQIFTNSNNVMVVVNKYSKCWSIYERDDQLQFKNSVQFLNLSKDKIGQIIPFVAISCVPYISQYLEIQLADKANSIRNDKKNIMYTCTSTDL